MVSKAKAKKNIRGLPICNNLPIKKSYMIQIRIVGLIIYNLEILMDLLYLD